MASPGFREGLSFVIVWSRLQKPVESEELTQFLKR